MCYSLTMTNSIHQKRLILTDADGVLIDWEKHFHDWMRARGYNQVKQNIYAINDMYDLSRTEGERIVREFNNSSWIGWCPALRDARSGIATLLENGYTFTCITSLSLDPYSRELRWQNLRYLFGKEAFDELICLDTAADKDEALESYRDSGLWWIEDNPKNALLGANLGLNTILIDHTYNREVDDSRIQRAKDWKDVTGIILNERSS